MCAGPKKPTAPALPIIKGIIFLGHKREDWQRGVLQTALIGCSLCACEEGVWGAKEGEGGSSCLQAVDILPARLTPRVAVGIDVTFTARHRSAAR